MRAPRVSVVLPCWNAASFLERALESVCAQSFPELEIVAVDDGSTDDTPRLLEDWARRDGRVRVVRREHEGLAAARELGEPEDYRTMA